MQITNYLQVYDWLGTSGQPTSEQFTQIASAGYKTVINLALPISEGAIAEEGAIVTGLEMNYIHIPVVWDSPKPDQYKLFAHLLNGIRSEKVWVHCMLNMRVSCFVFLYRVLEMGVNIQEASRCIHEIWDPDDVWNVLIAQVLGRDLELPNT